MADNKIIVARPYTYPREILPKPIKTKTDSLRLEIKYLAKLNTFDTKITADKKFKVINC
jgi:hypothetical protein